MAGTLGSQLASQNQQQQSRTTRTQRVILRDEQRIAQQKFQQLESEANQIKPSMQGLTIEEYSQKYNALSPDLKQFFLSPDEVRQSAEYKQYEQKRAEYDSQIAEINKQNSEWEQAQLWYDRVQSGIPVGTLPSGVQEKFKKLMKENELAQTQQQQNEADRQKIIAEYQQAGYYPIYNEKTKVLTGFIDVERNIEIPLSNINAEIQNKENQQEASQELAKKYLTEKEFGKGADFNAPEQSALSKVWNGVKTVWYSNALTGFGYGGISESLQKQMTSLRSQRTVETFTKPSMTDGTVLGFGRIPQIELATFGSLPLDKTSEVIQKQRGFDYKAEQSSKLLEQLDTISKEANPQLSPYVYQEGMKILQGKGLQVKEETKTSEFELFKAGQQTKKGTETTTYTITDPAFERRLSQNMLEYEKYRKEGDIMGAVAVAGRTVSLKAIETYAEWKGAEYVIKGAISGIKYTKDALGTGLKIDKAWRTGTTSADAVVSTSWTLPKILTTKTVQLASGFAKVPRDYALLKTSAVVGLTGFYGYSKYKQYEQYKATSPYGKEFFAIETAGELSGIEMATGIGQRTINRAVNRIKNWNLETRKQTDISTESFMRQNKKLGMQEKVYMERYEGFRLKYPKSWLQTLQGYEKGQFTGRTYKYIPDEVLSYYKYGGDVTVFRETKTGAEMVKAFKIDQSKGLLFAEYPAKSIKAEAFPFDARQKHLEWFMRKNIQEYGVGTYSKLPISTKGKAFGYSATGKAWSGTEYPPDVIVSDKGVLVKTKGGYQFVSGKGVSAGFFRVFSRGTEEGIGKKATDPILYANYFDKIQVNKAIREIRGISQNYGTEMKAYIYPKDTGVAGTLNIPLYKKEVEGTVEIARRIPIRKAFAIRLEGWKIPIEEQVFAEAKDLSASEVKAITKSMGGITEKIGVSYSSLPSRTSSLKRAIYSVVGYSKPSISKSYSVSSISKASSVSEFPSSVSLSSSSRASRTSSSMVSEIMSRIYNISKSVTSSTTEIPREHFPSKPRINLFPMGELKEKVKEKLKKKKSIENFALFPDFTARAIGVAPKRVKSVKEALREMEKIQTGFEVRSGASLNGMSEKELMRGIMK